ncbi:MAG: IMPACT family protein [Christensenellales bacterium]|jgi:putative IMPACT (imprinted ancient) family translation regulator
MKKPLSYRSLAREGRSDITVMKSRFLGYAAPTLTVEEAHAFLASVEQRHPDASALLYGYVCGLSGQYQKFEDSHEPSGGLAILEAVKRPGLIGVTAAVARYWGGVKLGASNLGRTFGRAAIEAIQDGQPCLFHPSLRVRLTADYGDTGRLDHYLSNSPHLRENTVYGERVEITLLLRKDRMEELEAALRDITRGSGGLQTIEALYAPWPE